MFHILGGERKADWVDSICLYSAESPMEIYYYGEACNKGIRWTIFRCAGQICSYGNIEDLASFLLCPAAVYVTLCAACKIRKVLWNLP